MQRPVATEHNPRFSTYINLVPAGAYTDTLQQNTDAVLQLFEQLPADKYDHAYAEGKWTLKQVLQHIADTERVMSYRALAALRGDNTALFPGMDENEYADH